MVFKDFIEINSLLKPHACSVRSMGVACKPNTRCYTAIHLSSQLSAKQCLYFESISLESVPCRSDRLVPHVVHQQSSKCENCSSRVKIFGKFGKRLKICKIHKIKYPQQLLLYMVVTFTKITLPDTPYHCPSPL